MLPRSELDGAVGADGEDLAAATEAAGADPGVLGKLGEGAALGNEHIARVLAFGDGGEDEICVVHQRHGDRDVLEGVDGEVDFAVEQGLFEFLGEESFAAEFVEGFFGDLVAGGFEDDQLDGEGGVGLFEFGGNKLGLGFGEQGASGAQAKGGGGIGHGCEGGVYWRICDLRLPICDLSCGGLDWVGLRGNRGWHCGARVSWLRFVKTVCGWDRAVWAGRGVWGERGVERADEKCCARPIPFGTPLPH